MTIKLNKIMKTTTDLKKRLTKGTKLLIKFHKNLYIRGNTGDLVLLAPKGQLTREVISCSSAGNIKFLNERGTVSHLALPKKEEIQFNEDGFTILDSYNHYEPNITYTFV